MKITNIKILSASFLRLMPIWIINNIKMWYYNRIDLSEGIDVNKAGKSKECDIYRYWYFLNKGFKFQPNVCNECHDLLMISMNLSSIATLALKSKVVIITLLSVELAKVTP